MNSLFYKITVFILIAACAILCVDRIRQNVYMAGIASRIAEKNKVMEQKNAEIQEKLNKLQNLIRERKQRFHFVLYSETLPDADGLTESQSLPSLNARDVQMTKDLAFTAKTETPRSLTDSAALLFRKTETEPGFDDLFLDPATGLIASRQASILTHAAKSKGMNARTIFFWDLRTQSAKASVTVSAPILKGASGTPLPQSVLTLTGGKRPEKGLPSGQSFICQRGTESVVFPFSISGLGTGEKVILPPKTKIPVGGAYLHYFHSIYKDCWLLEYSFPAGTDSQEYKLQVIPLLPDVTVSTHVAETVQSFLIRPGHSGISALLIVGDRPFFPAAVTASRAVPRLNKTHLK